MVRKTRSQIHLKRLFEDVVWDKQFSFIVCSITPFQVANALPPLWLLVFGVWYLILLNSECVTFYFILCYFCTALPLDIRVNVYCVCACVYIICFSFFGLCSRPAFHPSIVLCLNNFSFCIHVSCLLFTICFFYCGYCVMLSKQDLTISISSVRVFEYSVVQCIVCSSQFFFVELGCFSFFSQNVLLIFQLSYDLVFGSISYLAYNLFIVFPLHLALAFHCMF